MAPRVMKTTSATGNKRPWKRAAAGFTLIELSIALFIISILVALLVPNFIRSYNSQMLNSTGRSVITACEFARLNAVLHQQKVAFHVDLDKSKIWLTLVGTTRATDSIDSQDEALKTIEIPGRVGLASMQIGDQTPQQKGQVEVLFYPNGTCDGFTIAFRGVEKGAGLAVVVDPVTSRGMPWDVKP
jgi:prepilin-type N-terminal cleavage/methylation domain-containing protein